MGYAIPISDVYELIQDLMNQTTRTEVIDEAKRGYLGITGTDVTSDVSTTFGLPLGVYVSSVTEGSAAQKAGLVKGNIITKFDGKTVSNISSLQNLLTYYKAGEKVKMTIKVQNGSDYEEKEITVTLSSAKDAGIKEQSKNDNKTQQLPSSNSGSNENKNRNSYPNFDDWFNHFFD